MICSNPPSWINYPSNAATPWSHLGFWCLSNHEQTADIGISDRIISRKSSASSSLPSGYLLAEESDTYDVFSDYSGYSDYDLRSSLYPSNSKTVEAICGATRTTQISYNASIEAHTRFYYIDLRKRNIVIDPANAYTLGYGAGISTEHYAQDSRQLYDGLLAPSPWTSFSMGWTFRIYAVAPEAPRKFVYAKVLTEEQSSFVASAPMNWFGVDNFSSLDAPDTDDLISPMWAGGLLVMAPPLFREFSWNITYDPAWENQSPLRLRTFDLIVMCQPNKPTEATSLSVFSALQRYTLGLDYDNEFAVSGPAFPADSIIIR